MQRNSIPLRFALLSMTAFILTPEVRAQEIPLDIIGDRLGINVGVNGGKPEEYLFDTGSDSFNIDVGTSSASQSWFPGNTAAQLPVSNLTPYLYGNGSYGYLIDQTTVSSVQFYNSTTATQIAGYTSSEGYAVSVAPYWIATETSLYGDTAGIVIDNPALTASGYSTSPYYQDLSWQQNIDNGTAPQENYFYGIFGAGDFVTTNGSGGIPGQLTSTGYVVEANGSSTTPDSCGEACLILGLTPEIRAQFFSLVPWSTSSASSFPVSGANASTEYDTLFKYTLSNGTEQASATLLTLLDTGTPTSALLSSSTLIQQATSAGLVRSVFGQDYVTDGTTLTIAGASADTTSYTTDGSFLQIEPTGSSTGRAITGVDFFFDNAVMYDLQNKETGYTPFYITTDNFTNGLSITSDMGPLGVAGVISGTNGVTVEENANAFLTAANTYSGTTTIATDGWLGIGGPGSIANSSGVADNGTLDILHSDGVQSISSLTGNGQVILGANTLVLSAAHGIFSGSIRNFYPADTDATDAYYPVIIGGIAGQTYGGLIIDAGQETLTGTSTYTGETGISENASLILTGMLTASQIDNAGFLENDGTTGNMVISTGSVAGIGNFAGGLNVASGTVSPGTPTQTVPGTMSVGTSLTLGQDATYRVTTTEKSSSLIDVTGTASINGATLAVVPAAQNAALTLGQHSTILTATDGVTGTFGTAEIGATTSENAFPFLAPSVSYAADSVSLDITRSAIQFTEAARTRNEYALASALDGMSPYAALISPVTQLNFANARTAFNALSGELHASLRTALIQDSYDLRNAVTDRLRAADCAPGAGANGMKTASYQHGERMKDDGQCHAGQAALWMQAYGEWSHNGGTAGTRGMSNSTGGFILGGDTPIADHWHLGGLFAYGHSGFSAGSAGNGHSNNASLGAYAGRNWGALGLRLGATYTWNILSTTRHIAFSGFTDRTSSNYLGGTAQTFADLGYRFNVLKTLSVEPFGNVAYVNQQTNSFAETGGAASLAGRGMNTGVTFATFGTRLATRMRIGETRIEPNITLAYRHAFGMMTPTVWQNILSGSSAFETAGIPLLQDAAVVNAGVRVSISDTTGFNVGYSGQYGARFSDSGLRGSFSLQF